MADLLTHRDVTYKTNDDSSSDDQLQLTGGKDQVEDMAMITTKVEKIKLDSFITERDKLQRVSPNPAAAEEILVVQQDFQLRERIVQENYSKHKTCFITDTEDEFGWLNNRVTLESEPAVQENDIYGASDSRSADSEVLVEKVESETRETAVERTPETEGPPTMLAAVIPVQPILPKKRGRSLKEATKGGENNLFIDTPEFDSYGIDGGHETAF